MYRLILAVVAGLCLALPASALAAAPSCVTTFPTSEPPSGSTVYPGDTIIYNARGTIEATPELPYAVGPDCGGSLYNDTSLLRVGVFPGGFVGDIFVRIDWDYYYDLVFTENFIMSGYMMMKVPESIPAGTVLTSSNGDDVLTHTVIAKPAPEIPDTTGPTVKWLAPTDGAVVSGAISEVNGKCLADAHDPSGIDHTDNYVDGKVSDTQVSAPWGCVVDTTKLTDGPHTLRVRAFDKLGNFSDASIQFRVKNAGATTPVGTSNSSPTFPPGTAVTGSGTTATTLNGDPVRVVVTGSTITVTTEERQTTSQLLLTAREARRVADKSLRAKYSTYRHGTARRTTCARVSAVQRRCRVTWRHKRRQFRKSVTVRSIRTGYTVRIRSAR